MISSNYFLSANHDHPTPGQTITFHLDNNPNGPTFTDTVASWSYQTQYNGYGSDLYLGELTTPVPSSVAIYPVMALDAVSPGQVIWTYGYPNRVGKSAITDFTDINWVSDGYGYTRCMEFAYHATGGQGFDEAYLEPGDSGGPSFEVVKGSLAVVGMHFYNSYPPAIYDGAVSGDSFAPFYISQLDANMSGGQQVSVIPEPACLSLLVLGGLAMLRRRK